MDRCQERMVKKLASLFDGAQHDAEMMIRERLEKEDELRDRARVSGREFRPLDLLDLIVGFARLAGAEIKRQTPLIDLLAAEFKLNDSRSEKLCEPREVFDLASLPFIYGRIRRGPIHNIH